MTKDLSYLSYPLPPDIQRLFEAGDFDRMARVIRQRLEDPRVPKTLHERLRFQLIIAKEIPEYYRLTQADMRAEFVILAMRLREGVDESEYERRFGRSFCGDYGAQLGKFTRLGMIEKTERGYRLTDVGICVSNAVLCEFV